MDILISLLIIILIAGLIYWVIGMVPLPPPFRTVAYIVFAIILLLILLSYLPLGLPTWYHRP